MGADEACSSGYKNRGHGQEPSLLVQLFSRERKGVPMKPAPPVTRIVDINHSLRDLRYARNSGPRSGRASARATVDLRKSSLVPLSKRWHWDQARLPQVHR